MSTNKIQTVAQDELGTKELEDSITKEIATFIGIIEETNEPTLRGNLSIRGNSSLIGSISSETSIAKEAKEIATFNSALVGSVSTQTSCTSYSDFTDSETGSESEEDSEIEGGGIFRFLGFGGDEKKN